ncbi:class I SAM-dependent methyltransferase [bacterium]|nr:class I SAM-dependent methyltransferase [bacterium]
MQPATDNQKFIDGSWYEEQYLSGFYRLHYINKPSPQWAKETKAYYINRILMYTGLPLSTKILDLGASSGQSMRAWQERGFEDVHGIEISHIAVLHGSMPNLRQGTVQNMPYKDKEFDLVFSSALFEHIDESILDDVLKECFRVGVIQAHTLCLDKGTDPSHVNIKTPGEWLEAFEKHTKDLAFVISDELLLTGPILMVIPEERLSYPLGRKFIRDAADNNHKQH